MHLGIELGGDFGEHGPGARSRGAGSWRGGVEHVKPTFGRAEAGLPYCIQPYTAGEERVQGGALDLGSYDLLVAGGGNAALCAAISAAERGLRVVICEAAPHGLRGGNSRHTRNLRVAHDAPTAVLVESYPVEEFFDDLMRVTAGKTNERLARIAISESDHVSRWIGQRGVRFQKALGGTLSLERTNAFFLGGGKALLNGLYRTAERLGVRVHYDTEVTALELEDGFFKGARLRHRGFEARIGARGVVVASGGFQANLDWLEEAWGPAARNFTVRGTEYAQGTLLRQMLDAGMRGGRRGRPVPRHRARRPGAEVRRRHRQPGRLGAVLDHGQPQRRAVLRRGRGFLAQALCHLGPAGRPAARADRLFDHRRQGAAAVHARPVPAGPVRDRGGAGGGAGAGSGPAGADGGGLQRRLHGRAVRSAVA